MNKLAKEKLKNIIKNEKEKKKNNNNVVDDQIENAVEEIENFLSQENCNLNLMWNSLCFQANVDIDHVFKMKNLLDVYYRTRSNKLESIAHSLTKRGYINCSLNLRNYGPYLDIYFDRVDKSKYTNMKKEVQDKIIRLIEEAEEEAKKETSFEKAADEIEDLISREKIKMSLSSNNKRFYGYANGIKFTLKYLINIYCTNGTKGVDKVSKILSDRGYNECILLLNPDSKKDLEIYFSNIFEKETEEYDQ